MALNTQTQSLALPLPQLFFSSSFLPSAYIQIKYLHLLGRLGCLLVFSAHVICLFKFPVALMSLHVLFFPLFSHIFLLLSPSLFLQFLFAIFTHTLCLFCPPLFLFLTLSSLAAEVVSVRQPVSGGSSRKWAE